jgi:hypothetical protein
LDVSSLITSSFTPLTGPQPVVAGRAALGAVTVPVEMVPL